MHTIRHFLNCVILTIVVMAASMCGSFFSCGFSTGSSVPKRQSIDISEWIGDYHGTAMFIAAQKRVQENEWDPQWLKRKSMDGKVQSIEIKILHTPDNPDNMADIELHMEYPIVSFDPRNPSTSRSDVNFHLNLSLLSSTTIYARQYIESQNYEISLTRTITTITGTFGSGWFLGRYQLNLEKKKTGGK